MPSHTIGQTSGSSPVSSASNPVTTSITIGHGESVLAVGIVPSSATLRTGGAPTFGGRTLVQVDSTRQAVTTPETSTELWVLENPPVGAGTLSIPNAGVLTLNVVWATARSSTGYSEIHLSNGGTNTSTNPTASITPTKDGCMLFSVCGNGAQTWAPSARDGTQIQDTDLGSVGMGSQYFAQGSAGAKAMGWTFATSEDWNICVVAIAPRNDANACEHYRGVKAGDGLSVTEHIN